MWSNWDSQRLLKSFHFGNQAGGVFKSSTYTYNMTYDLAIALQCIYSRNWKHTTIQTLYINTLRSFLTVHPQRRGGTLISSVQFSRSVMSDYLQPQELEHARFPGPSRTPRAYSNSCPWSQWCHPTISSSINSFSFCLQSFSASGSFPKSSHQVAKVLEFQLQHQSFKWIFMTDFL